MSLWAPAHLACSPPLKDPALGGFDGITCPRPSCLPGRLEKRVGGLAELPVLRIEVSWLRVPRTPEISVSWGGGGRPSACERPVSVG